MAKKNKPKHTAGPWRVLGAENPSVYAGEMRICDVRGWGYLIGQGAMGLPQEQAAVIQDANANLIASAPDLLDATKHAASALAEWIDMENITGEDFQAAFRALDLCRAAIRKARGES